MKKKYIKIIIIIFLIGLIAFGIKNAIPVVKEKLFFNQIKNIEYDVKVIMDTKSGYQSEGASSENIHYDLINLKKAKLYCVRYTDFVENTPIENYSFKTKDLTQEEVQEILKLSNMESEEVDKKEKLDGDYRDIITDIFYWTILYNGKEMKFNELPFSSEILEIN